ncbi:MAG TPA: OmpH family outer membrane protein [Vicinamibacterales bacterium]|jgi:outer membrane protein
MKVSATAALLAVSLIAIGAGPAFAQAAGQPPQPKPTIPAPQTPAQPPAATPAPPQPPPPFPAGAKVAFINPQRIFQESADGKSALTRVQALTQKKQTENTNRQKALQDNQQKLQASGSVMSDAARDQLQKEIEKQQLELQRFQQDAQAEITELQNEVQNEFARKVQPLIDQMAKEKGLHMVFNAGDAGFAWVDAGLDLSSEIIKKLDAAKGGTAPKP